MTYRPREIKIAVFSSLSLLIIEYMDYALMHFGVTKPYPDYPTTLESILFLSGIVLALLFGIWKRLNWVRILFVVIMGSINLMNAPLIKKEFAIDTVGGILLVIQLSLILAAIYYLLTGNANAWFRNED